MTAGSARTLVRALGGRDLTAFTVNSIVGAGIFGIPAILAGRVGPLSWLAMLVAAGVVALIALCFAEMGSAFGGTGGPYLYARHLFGPAIGFQVGWLMWIARLTGFASVTNLFVSYLGYFVPAAAAGAARGAIIVALTILFTVVNLIGVRRAATVANALTIAKLVPLALFVGIGITFVASARLLRVSGTGVAPLAGAVMLAVYAFSGFELVAVPAGEVRDPARTVPRSLLGAIAIVAVLYVGVQLVCVGVLPGLATTARPLAEAARITLGEGAARVMVLGALLSTLGVSHTIVLAAARLPFAMAEQGQLPGVLAAVHPRFRTPYVSLFLSAACMLAFTLVTTFTSAVTLTVGFRVVVYLITCAGLPVLRRRRDGPTAAFRLPGGNLIAVSGMALCVTLLAMRPWLETRQLLAAVAAGFAIFLVTRSTRQSGVPR